MSSLANARRASVQETAELVRAALQATFPTITFSVRRNNDDLTVTWTDGPSVPTVTEVTDGFQGIHLIDKGHIGFHASRLTHADGRTETVRFQVDWVLHQRRLSDPAQQQVEADMRRLFGTVRPGVHYRAIYHGHEVTGVGLVLGSMLRAYELPHPVARQPGRPAAAPIRTPRPVVDLTDRGQTITLPARHPYPSGRLHALGCPLTDCCWQSPPYPATTDHHDIAAVAAYIEHIYDAHPQYRGLIDHARAAVRTGDAR